MRALITGATGFIGTALAKRLSGDGEFEVYGLVRFVSQGRKLLNNNNVEYVVGDLTDYYRAYAKPPTNELSQYSLFLYR